VIEPDTVVVETGVGPDIVAYDYGGTGPNVLFLHATGMHGRMWDPVIKRVEGLRCLSVDARGHGQSAIDPDVSMDWTEAASDIESVIERFAVSDSLSVVGHSFGGCLAMILEANQPGLFESAWLYEPIIAQADLRGFVGDDNGMAKGARRRREVFESTDAAFERYMSRPPFSHCDPESIRSYVDHGFEPVDGGVRLRCRAETEARTFEASSTDVFERLGSVQASVTIVSSGDGGPPMLLAPHVAEAIPNARLERWDDRSHFGPLEDPARVADSIQHAL
jgi:pimeloyl-ACP methyl ester carboxylesterase